MGPDLTHHSEATSESESEQEEDDPKDKDSTQAEIYFLANDLVDWQTARRPDMKKFLRIGNRKYLDAAVKGPSQDRKSQDWKGRNFHERISN